MIQFLWYLKIITILYIINKYIINKKQAYSSLIIIASIVKNLERQG